MLNNKINKERLLFLHRAAVFSGVETGLFHEQQRFCERNSMYYCQHFNNRPFYDVVMCFMFNREHKTEFSTACDGMCMFLQDRRHVMFINVCL